MTLRFETAMVSEPGGRPYNEDACGYYTSDRGSCWVLADGAGGHGGGDTASRTAVSQILADFTQGPSIRHDDLARLVERANDAILDAQLTAPELADMRTTLALVAIDPEASLATWANAGDSRVYLFRGARMIYRSRDHSVVQEMIDAGLVGRDASRTHPHRNVLTSGLGGGDVSLNLSEQPMRVNPGDVFMLCSDGFWEYVEEPDMERTLAQSEGPEGWLEAMTAVLRERAPAGSDNFTSLVAWLRPGE